MTPDQRLQKADGLGQACEPANEVLGPGWGSHRADRFGQLGQYQVSSVAPPAGPAKAEGVPCCGEANLFGRAGERDGGAEVGDCALCVALHILCGTAIDQGAGHLVCGRAGEFDGGAEVGDCSVCVAPQILGVAAIVQGAGHSV